MFLELQSEVIFSEGGEIVENYLGTKNCPMSCWM